ncbi:shikimate dehydrogenase [Fervidibacillus halotolerans]|uniref:Shikimate dehydrogenase (NADP(+)) n=1 Tax=Fervidibacillus halotolerans TaxID=2980027 RepID=A0A9E8LXH8_9BACI|nr:shikimate dehydrogenase [Fervidibacillus halotolerans]WAA11528.1 shikimate dehydrogenase [Fervidibacillus halotolerans]
MDRYGVIGDPIDHSLSPVIHHQFLFEANIEGEYRKILIPRSDLEKGIQMLRREGIKGFNVTIPHKEAIIPLLDEVDETAIQIGAVNTVVYKNGKFIGYNTDGYGFIRALKTVVKNLTGMKIAVIGAGGAARAVYFSLYKENVERIDVANRTIENARRLIGKYSPENFSEALSLEQLYDRMGNYDLIIQTTPVGMYPNVHELPISLNCLKKGTIVFDLIYRPLETEFLALAKKKGAIVENGINMLLYQAARSFWLWTGIDPDIESARKKMMKQLKGA